jgi:uncharacterized protein YlxW (UPF0749 family)
MSDAGGPEGTDGSRSGRADPFVSAGVVGFLSEVLHDSLDPGYAQAARAPQDDAVGGFGRRVPALLLCAVLGVVFAVGYRYTADHAVSTDRVRGDLVARVKSAQSNAARLAAQANRLNGEVRAAQESTVARGPGEADLSRAEAAAGTVAVHGPGLVVTLNNPPAGGSGPNGSLLTDLDLRAVVNALWAAGAEAISINNERLTPVSAIRFAGSAILVDFQPLSAPYVIRAIGAANTLNTRFAVGAVADRYRTLAAAYGFGFAIAQSEQLRLPAATAHQNRYATPDRLRSARQKGTLR